MLVNKKTAPRINSISPGVPVTVLVKYNMANTAASNTRIIRSVVPMFFFIKKIYCTNLAEASALTGNFCYIQLYNKKAALRPLFSHAHKIDFYTFNILLWHTKFVTGTAVLLIAPKPPSTSVKLR